MRGRLARPSRAHGEAGVTLPEILVSIVILGVCVVFLLGGTSALPIATSVHQEDAQADALLKQWAEAVQAKGLTTSNLCSTGNSNPYSVQSLVNGNFLPSGFPAITVGGAPTHNYTASFTHPLQPVVTWTGTPTSPSNSCSAASSTTFARVGLTITWIGTTRPASQSTDVVVSSV
jgi:prepilin-type N-terminal cleavage/methylation domain-containing protein